MTRLTMSRPRSSGAEWEVEAGGAELVGQILVVRVIDGEHGREQAQENPKEDDAEPDHGDGLAAKDTNRVTKLRATLAATSRGQPGRGGTRSVTLDRILAGGEA
jgi:hypothetical protein